MKVVAFIFNVINFKGIIFNREIFFIYISIIDILVKNEKKSDHSITAFIYFEFLINNKFISLPFLDSGEAF